MTFRCVSPIMNQRLHLLNCASAQGCQVFISKKGQINP